MNPLNYNQVATALARYVRDFLPAPAHGVAVIQQHRDQGALLAVYGKSDGGGKAELGLTRTSSPRPGWRSPVGPWSRVGRPGPSSSRPAGWSSR